MKLLISLLLLFLFSGCNHMNQAENSHSEGEHSHSGIIQTSEDHVKNSDEILVEVKDETFDAHDKQRLNQAEAEQLVKDKLEIKEQDDLVVQYDHIENDDYIIHVYSTNRSQEKSEGWYLVNLEAKVVEKLKR